MTNKQAALAARRIPFDSDNPLPPSVFYGLRRVVRLQIERADLSRESRALRRWYLQRLGGVR